MQTNKMTKSVKIITALEFGAFIFMVLYSIILYIYTVNVANRMIEAMTPNISSSNRGQLYAVSLVGSTFAIPFVLPYLIVAIRNVINKKSNNNILIIVFSGIYSILLLIGAIKSFSTNFLNLFSITYLVILIILIVQQMKKEKQNQEIYHNQTSTLDCFNQHVNAQQYCSKCGKGLNENEKFCQNCGAKQNDQPF